MSLGALRMEQRRQQLHVAAADAELVLAAAVGAHPALLAELVALEECLQRAEARRLEVHGPRHHGRGEDVIHVVDRRVPRDAVLERRQRVARLLGLEVGILEPGVRERLGDAPVEVRIGLRVDDRAAVGALEVDRVDGAGLLQRLDQLVRPVRRGVELEADLRVALEAAGDGLDRRRVAHPRGDDERHGLRGPAEQIVQRRPRLAQREVERGGLEAPAPVAAVDVEAGLEGREEVERRRDARRSCRTSTRPRARAPARRRPGRRAPRPRR